MPQTVPSPLLAQLPSQLLARPDDKMWFFVEFWHWMHTDRRPLVAETLRFVEWAEDSQTPRRFVWEVCRWPRGNRFRWTFVCWMADGVGMWSHAFSSKRAALTYFQQAPDAVLGCSSDAAPIRAAS